MSIDFRRHLLFFGSIGFVVTLLVAWVTTRHVVKPTEELTIDRHRIALVQSGHTILGRPRAGADPNGEFRLKGSLFLSRELGRR